jgi:isochorismate synthase
VGGDHPLRRIHDKTVRLFAGAGIVPASSPVGEWRETG